MDVAETFIANGYYGSVLEQDFETGITKVERRLMEKLAEKVGDKIKINVLKLGYEKVLGSGKITKPLIIEAKYFSKDAIKKLEKAEGEAVKI